MKRKAEPDAEEMTSSKGPSTSKKLAPDANNDFINETELQKSIQVSVLKTADVVAQRVREDGGGQVQFHPDVIAQVSALIWDTVSGDWTSDLFAFSNHAKRQTVNVSDVALLMRKNKQLLDIVSKAADIDLGEYERPTTKRQSSNRESTRGKRGCRAGTSRPSTALDAPILRSGVLTPRSELDGNFGASFCEEVRNSSLEQKAPEVAKIVEDFDDDVIVADAVAKADLRGERSDVGQDVGSKGSFSGLVVEHSKDVTLVEPHAAESAMNNGGEASLLSNVLETTTTTPETAHIGTPVSSYSTLGKSRQQISNMLNVENSPPMIKPCLGKKAPSPDLFNTPVKGSSDEFEDFFDIPDIHNDEQRPEPMKNDEGAVRPIEKLDGGWSVKFSAFSFFDDDDLEQTAPSTCNQDRLQSTVNQEEPTPAPSSSKSGVKPPSMTLKSSHMPSSKRKLPLSYEETPRQPNVVGVKRRQNKIQTATPRRPNDPKSALKGSAEKSLKPPAPVFDEFDSDEEFFSLK